MDRVRRQAGFTMVELLSLVAVTAVLLTLLASMFANARVRRQQAACMDNLRQVALAVQLYTRETDRRPRSLSRVIAHTPAEIRPTAFICPADPALRKPAGQERATNTYWGNFANASQEPWAQSDLRDPESGSWTLELAEVSETEPFSYLHPLAWRRPAWQRLAALGPETGTAVCQLHGVKVPPSPGFKPYMQYEGELLRAANDGSVVKRKVFRPAATPESPPGSDYPWEFYTDTPQASSR